MTPHPDDEAMRTAREWLDAADRWSDPARVASENRCVIIHPADVAELIRETATAAVLAFAQHCRSARGDWHDDERERVWRQAQRYVRRVDEVRHERM